MLRQIIAALCVLSLAGGADAANPTHRLRPGDADALRSARIEIKCEILNAQQYPDNPHYAFWITAGVPEGLDWLDATFAVGSDKGLVSHSSWRSSEGKCVLAFMVGEAALKDAWFSVQLHKGDPLKSEGWSASGRYLLKLSEFTGERGAAPANENFEISNSIKKDGPKLTIAVKRKDALTNHWYDLKVSVEGRADQ
jgi:hypothetical protein